MGNLSLASDYFLLYHGMNDVVQTVSYGTNEYKDKDEFFDICALVLCANRKDYEKFITLHSFKKLVRIRLQKTHCPKVMMPFGKKQWVQRRMVNCLY